MNPNSDPRLLPAPAQPLTIIDELRTRRGYISSTDTMEILGVSRQTLCRWVSEGRIPATRIGPSNKFDPQDLANWLAARRITLAA